MYVFTHARMIEGMAQTSVTLSTPPILWLPMVVRGDFKLFVCIYPISWDDGGFPCFGRVRVFPNEEHSIGSSVLRISGSDDVVHTFIGLVRISLDAARITIESCLLSGL